MRRAPHTALSEPKRDSKKSWRKKPIKAVGIEATPREKRSLIFGLAILSLGLRQN